MKNLLLGTALVALSGGAVLGQDVFRMSEDPMALRASNFIGMRVYAADESVDVTEINGMQDGWNDIGEINDVILTREGAVDAVLVDIGGFLGMGERQVALGMENIRFVSDSATADNAEDFFIVVNANRGLLESAPAYGAAIDGAAPASAADAVVTDTGTAAATEGTDTAMADSMMDVDLGTLTAEELIGVNVYGPNDESVGEVSDVVLNDQGGVASVIVDVGGFLGMGSKPVALETTALMVKREGADGMLHAMVSMTKDDMQALPEATIGQ